LIARKSREKQQAKCMKGCIHTKDSDLNACLVKAKDLNAYRACARLGL
jgi:hypothetical protein